jgi:hypothetical protein
MIKRNTWIILGIFVLVLAFAIYYQNSPKTTAASATPTTGSKGLFTNVEEKSINTLRIEDTNGKAVALGRDSSGVWVVTEPKGGPTDVTQAETAVTQLLALQSIASLNPTNDLGIFGLSKPSYTVTIVMNGGQKYVLLIGDVTPTQNGYYVRLNQDAPDIVNKDSIDAMLGMLNNPPFVATPTSQASGTPAAGTGTPASTSTTPAPGLSPTSGPTSTPPATQTPPAALTTVAPLPTQSASATPTP